MNRIPQPSPPVKLDTTDLSDDKTIDDMSTLSKSRIRREIDKRKYVPSTLHAEIQKALG